MMKLLMTNVYKLSSDVCESIPDVGHIPPWGVTLRMLYSAFFCFAGGFCANMSYYFIGV